MSKKVFNTTGAVLDWIAPEGVPSAVTSVTVRLTANGSDSTAEAATTGAASIDATPSTTFNADSGQGEQDATRLALASIAGIEVGGEYLVTNSLGESEQVEITGVVSGGTVAYARHALRNSYAIGDSLQTTRLSIALSDSWLADTANISDDTDPNPYYRVRWEYVVGGQTFVHADYFDVVRFEAKHDVTPLDIDNESPGWIDSLPMEYTEDRGKALIEAAYGNLEFDLFRRGIPSEMMRNRDVVNRLTILRTILNSSKNRAKATGDTIGYEIDRDEYNASLDGLVPLTDIATDTSGAATSKKAMSLWQR